MFGGVVLSDLVSHPQIFPSLARLYDNQTPGRREVFAVRLGDRAKRHLPVLFAAL